MKRRDFLNRASLLALGATATVLGGCGRRSMVKAPEGGTYPREYPTPQATGMPATIPEAQGPARVEEQDPSGPLGPLPTALPPRY